MNDATIFINTQFFLLTLINCEYLSAGDQLLQLLCLPLSWFIRLALALACTICNSTLRIRNWISPFLQLPTQVGSLSTRRTELLIYMADGYILPISLGIFCGPVDGQYILICISLCVNEGKLRVS